MEKSEVILKLDAVASLEADVIEHEKILSEARSELASEEYNGYLEEWTEDHKFLEDKIEELKAEITAGVIEAGESIKGAAKHAVFYTGNVKLDLKGLDNAMAILPQLRKLRTEDEPTVQFRDVK